MKRTFAIALSALISWLILCPVSAKPITYIWDMNELVKLSENPSSNEYKSLIKRAKGIVAQKPVAVTDKSICISGDKHNYESLSPYWWPDPKNPGGPYIARDGESNPESQKYDYPRLLKLKDNLVTCSKAFFLTGDTRYYDFFCRQLDTWFINADTRMTPNFEYCQFIPGRNNGKGNPQGMIGAYDFNDILESIRLIDSVKAIGKKRTKALKAWFGDFAEWMQTSNYGMTASNFKNNQAVAYDVSLYNFCLFMGKKSPRKRILNAFYEKRVLPQIDDEGKMPEELRRTRAYDYSLYNMTHLIDFCFLVENDVLNMPDETVSRIRNGLQFLQSYKNNQESFPYKEMKDWSYLFKKLDLETKRLKKLYP